MKNSLIFAVLYCILCLTAPLAIVSCNKVEAQTLLTDNTISDTYSDDSEPFVGLIGGEPYMFTNTGKYPMTKVQDANKTYKFLLNQKEENSYLDIYMEDWLGMSHVVVEWGNTYFYSDYQPIKHELISYGTMLSESDYPIYRCNGEHGVMHNTYLLNTDNISEPLRSQILAGTNLQAYIEPTNQPCLFHVCFGFVDNGIENWYSTFIVKS